MKKNKSLSYFFKKNKVLIILCILTIIITIGIFFKNNLSKLVDIQNVPFTTEISTLNNNNNNNNNIISSSGSGGTNFTRFIPPASDQVIKGISKDEYDYYIKNNIPLPTTNDTTIRRTEKSTITSRITSPIYNSDGSLALNNNGNNCNNITYSNWIPVSDNICSNNKYIEYRKKNSEFNSCITNPEDDFRISNENGNNQCNPNLIYLKNNHGVVLKNGYYIFEDSFFKINEFKHLKRISDNTYLKVNNNKITWESNINNASSLLILSNESMFGNNQNDSIKFESWNNGFIRNLIIAVIDTTLQSNNILNFSSIKLLGILGISNIDRNIICETNFINPTTFIKKNDYNEYILSSRIKIN